MPDVDSILGPDDGGDGYEQSATRRMSRLGLARPYPGEYRATFGDPFGVDAAYTSGHPVGCRCADCSREEARP